MKIEKNAFSKKILIVEDDQKLNDLICEYLTKK